MFADGDSHVSQSPCSAASAMNPVVVSKEALRNVEVLLERPVRLKGLYPPSHVYGKIKDECQHSEQQRRDGRWTHHVIRDDGQMTRIHSDSVGPENTSHLLNDGRSSCFHSIRLEDITNLVRREAIEIDNAVSKRPRRSKVDSFCHGRSLLNQQGAASVFAACRGARGDGDSPR